MAGKTDCSICCSAFLNKDITKCPFCDILVCKTCVKTFIFSQKKVDAECMGCKNILSRSALAEMFGNTHFIEGPLKDHIKDVMFAEEKVRIPEILPIVKAKNDFDKRYNECLLMKEQLSTRRDELNRFISQCWEDMVHRNNYEFAKAKAELAGIDTFFEKNVCEKFDFFEHVRAQRNAPGNAKSKAEKPTYSFACANPECLGHIKGNGICDACDNKTCTKCFAFVGNKDTEHECKKEDVESADFIKKNSKPCPKCGISITHAGGCAQMWCANCHHVFNFSTGKAETGNIHNPEYFRYMRDNNITIPRYRPNNNPCGDDLTIAYNRLRASIKDKACLDSIIDIYRVINHINGEAIPSIRYDRVPTDTREMRFNLVTKQITEASFKTELAKRYKKRCFIEERLSIVESLRDIIQDEFVSLSTMEGIQQITRERTNEIVGKLNGFINTAITADENVLKIYGYTLNKSLGVKKDTKTPYHYAKIPTIKRI